MASPPVNQKTFKLINRISKSFDLIISNFAYAATLLFRIAFKITFSLSPKFILGAFSTINLRRIRVIISQVKLITSISQTFNARRIRLIMTMKERLKAIVAIYGRVRLTIISRATQKIFSSIIIRKISILSNPVLAQFFILGDFDPDTLGDLDGFTLGNMDYTTS